MLLIQRSICRLMNRFMKADKLNECHLLDVSIVKVIWQCVSAGGKRRKKQLKETCQDKAENRVMEWEQKLGLGGDRLSGLFVQLNLSAKDKRKLKWLIRRMPKPHNCNRQPWRHSETDSVWRAGLPNLIFVLINVFLLLCALQASFQVCFIFIYVQATFH